MVEKNKRNFRWLDNREVLLALQRTLESDARIAEVAGCTSSYVHKLRKRHGIPPRGVAGRPIRHPEIWKPELMSILLQHCGSPREVARFLHIEENTVRNAIVRQKNGEQK